jgi:hypothetical protein
MERQFRERWAFHRLGSTTAWRVFRAGIVAAASGIGATSVSPAQEIGVAHVASVSGRVVALHHGSPMLLQTFDSVRERTRLDLQANSELHICHYAMQRLLVLNGPLRASVSATSVTVETGRALASSKVPCAVPALSKFQGGLVTRGMVSAEDPGLRVDLLAK